MPDTGSRMEWGCLMGKGVFVCLFIDLQTHYTNESYFEQCLVGLPCYINSGKISP